MAHNPCLKAFLGPWSEFPRPSGLNSMGLPAMRSSFCVSHPAWGIRNQCAKTETYEALADAILENFLSDDVKGLTDVDLLVPVPLPSDRSKMVLCMLTDETESSEERRTTVRTLKEFSKHHILLDPISISFEGIWDLEQGKIPWNSGVRKVWSKTPLETTWLSHPTWYWNWEKNTAWGLSVGESKVVWGLIWE